MKIPNFLILNSILVVAQVASQKFNLVEENQSVQALFDVISELFVSREVSFEIDVYGESTKHIDDTISGILKRFDGKRPLMINRFDYLNALKDPAVVFIEPKFLQSNDLKNLFISNAFPKSMSFIFDVPRDFDLNALVVNPNSHRGHFSQFSYFLVDNETNVELKTFEWWTESKCNAPQLTTLNSYAKNTSKWTQSLTTPEKFENFNNCSLAMSSSIFPLNYVEYAKKEGLLEFVEDLREVYKKKQAHERQIHRIVAQHGNFSVIEPADEEKEHYMKLNFNDDDSPFEYSLYLKSFLYSEGSSPHCTAQFMQQTICAMYSPPEPYTNYEKMVLPFDPPTWMYLIITFGAAFALIFIMNLLPPVFKDIFYGENVKMPSFNVIGTFFGIGQTKLPDNNFARIILMSFIMFCLIFRTAYQGVFFEMMTSDMRKSSPATYADLKERNYTVHFIQDRNSIHVYVADQISHENTPRMELKTLKKMIRLYYKLKYPSTKAAMIVMDGDYKAIKMGNKNVPKLLLEKVRLPPFGVCTHRNSFAFRLVDKTMSRLVEGGLPQFMYETLLNFDMKELPDDPSQPSVFKVADLEFGFVVWLGACAVSTGAFIGEVLWVWMLILGSKIRRVATKCIFLYVLWKRMSERGF